MTNPTPRPRRFRRRRIRSDNPLRIEMNHAQLMCESHSGGLAFIFAKGAHDIGSEDFPVIDEMYDSWKRSVMAVELARKQWDEAEDIDEENAQ